MRSARLSDWLKKKIVAAHGHNHGVGYFFFFGRILTCMSVLPLLGLTAAFVYQVDSLQKNPAAEIKSVMAMVGYEFAESLSSESQC